MSRVQVTHTGLMIDLLVCKISFHKDKLAFTLKDKRFTKQFTLAKIYKLHSWLNNSSVYNWTSYDKELIKEFFNEVEEYLRGIK